MGGVNRVILLGRLGKDPESKSVGTQTVANFSIATSESYKDKATGEKKETTEWHNCVAWGAVAEIITKYVHKGDQVYVEGKLKTRSWEKDGVTRYVTEIVVNGLNLIGGNRDNGNNNSNQSSGSQQQSIASDIGDNIPF